MAKDTNLTLVITNPLGKADAGTKGLKRSWTATVDYDLRKIPAPLLEEFLHSGIRQWIKNSASSILVEADGLAAMQARLAKLEAGDMDRKYHYASPIDRRALDNLYAALHAGAAAEGIKATEEQLRAEAMRVLASPNGQQWRDEAKRQMDAESDRARKGGDSLKAALAGLAKAAEQPEPKA